MSQKAFFYVDGIQAKGAWIDLADINDWDDILTELVSQEFCDENYDDGILVADTEGNLAAHFLDKYDSFDLMGFIEASDSDIDEEAVAAYLSCFSSWDKSDFESRYYGKHDSDVEFVCNVVLEGTFDVDSLPAYIGAHIDWEGVARDIMMDFYADNGHYFADY